MSTKEISEFIKQTDWTKEMSEISKSIASPIEVIVRKVIFRQQPNKENTRGLSLYNSILISQTSIADVYESSLS